MNPDNITTQRITGVPKNSLQSKIDEIIADPDYNTHKVIQEDKEGKFWTIEVTLKRRNWLGEQLA